MHKARWISILFFAGLIAGFFFLMRGCLSKYDRYNTLPNAMLFEKDGKQIVFSILEYGKTNSYSQKRGMTSIAMSTTFYLQQYDAATLQKIKEKKWLDLADVKGGQIKIIGRSKNCVWLFANGISAIDPFTLETVADHEKIATINLFLKDRLTQEEQYYQWNYLNNTILITANDGTHWQLDPATLKATPVKASINDQISAGKKYRDIRDIWNVVFPDAFITNQDTMNSSFFGLYDENEINTQATNYRNDKASEEGKRRKLWQTSIQNLDYGVMVRYREAKPVGDMSYLNGGFIRDKNTASAIHLSGPDGYILMHQDQLGDAGTIQISRVSLQGKLLWTANTLSKEIISYDVDPYHLLLQGTTDIASQSKGDKLICIQLNDGMLKEVPVSK